MVFPSPPLPSPPPSPLSPSTSMQVEKQKADVQKELEGLQEQLEEEGGHKEAQIALNRKREEEISVIRKEMETQSADHERVVAEMKKKHTAAIQELEERADQLQKAKSKLVALS